MDAITLLRDDHKTVEALFKRFEKAGDRAYVEKREITDRIIEALSVHAAIEEQVFYPVTRATVPEVEDIALESLEEHHIVKWVLSELERMDPKDERFDAKVTVLIENVRHHVKEEEQDYFPKVRNGLGRAALADLGEALATAKRGAPTHPHPRSPDEPPGNAVVGAIAGVVDRVSDNISGFAQGGVTAVQDLIARIRGTAKPKVSPTGSKTARSGAKRVRRAASAATGGRARSRGRATA
jgi:hemerythrin superfamily protein